MSGALASRVISAGRMLAGALTLAFVLVATSTNPARADAGACIGVVTASLSEAQTIAKNAGTIAECATYAEDPLFIAITGVIAVLDAAGQLGDGSPDACQAAIDNVITVAMVKMLDAAINSPASPLYPFLQAIQTSTGFDLQGELNDASQKVMSDPGAVKDALSQIPGLDVVFGYLDCGCKVATSVVTVVKDTVQKTEDCAAFIAACLTGQENVLDCAGDLLASGLDAAGNLITGAIGDALNIGQDIICFLGGCPDQKGPPQQVNCADPSSPLTGYSFSKDPNGTIYALDKDGDPVQFCFCENGQTIQPTTATISLPPTGLSGAPVSVQVPAFQCVCDDPTKKVPVGSSSCTCPIGTYYQFAAGQQTDNLGGLSCGLCDTKNGGIIYGNKCMHCPAYQIAGDTLENPNDPTDSLHMYGCHACAPRAVPDPSQVSCHFCADGDIVSADGTSCQSCLLGIFSGNPMVLGDNGTQCISAKCPGDQHLISTVHNEFGGYTGFHCGCDAGSTPDKNGNCCGGKNVLDNNKNCVPAFECPASLGLVYNYNTDKCDFVISCVPGQNMVNKTPGADTGPLWQCQDCQNPNSCVVDNKCIPCPTGSHLSGQNACVPDNPNPTCPENTQSVTTTFVQTVSQYGGTGCSVAQTTCAPCADDELSDGTGACQKFVCVVPGLTPQDHTCQHLCGAGTVYATRGINLQPGGNNFGANFSTCVPCTGDMIADYGSKNPAGACKKCDFIGTLPNKDHTACYTPAMPITNCALLGADFVKSTYSITGQPAPCVLSCGPNRKPNADGTACVSSCQATIISIGSATEYAKSICLTDNASGAVGSNQNPCNGTLDKFTGAAGEVTVCSAPSTAIALPSRGSSGCTDELYTLTSSNAKQLTLCLKQAGQSAGAAGGLAATSGCPGGLESYSNAAGFKMSFCHTMSAIERQRAWQALTVSVIPGGDRTRPPFARDCKAMGPVFIRNPRNTADCIACAPGLVANADHTVCVRGGPNIGTTTLNCPPRMHPNPSRTGCLPDLDIGNFGRPGGLNRTPGGGPPSPPSPSIRGR